MDETRLRALLKQAVSAEPVAERPLGRIDADSRRGGRRLRRRRRAGGAVASIASVALVAVAVSFASGAFGHARKPSPAGHPGGSEQMAYVLTSSGDVIPVNLATMKVGRPLQRGLKGFGGFYSSDAVVAPGGKTLYVSTDRARILQISTETGKFRRIIQTIGGNTSFNRTSADQLVGAANGEIAYAVAYAENNESDFTPIDLATGRALRPISVPIESVYWESLRGNSKTVVAVGDGAHSARTTVATVINVASQRAQKPITIKGGSPLNCAAVNPDGAMDYVGVPSRQPFVVPIDVAANRPLRPIKLPRIDYGPNWNQCSMAVGPNGRTAYVFLGHYVVPIDLINSKVLRPIKLPFLYAPWPHIGIDADGSMAYAIARQGVTPIDLATNKALPSISFANNFFPFCLAFSANGATALVGISSEYNSGKLVLIHAATGKVIKTIRMPSTPSSIVVTPGR